MLHRRHLATTALAAVLAGTVLSGCGDDDTVVQDAQEEGPAAVAAILGEPVTIEAEVQDVLGPRAFTVGENETLVLSATEATVEDGSEVVATGTVRQFVIADFEEEYDWFDFGDEDWAVELERDLVLVADGVQPLP